MEVTIEGSFIKEPFVTQLVGQLKIDQKRANRKVLVYSFTIQKQIQAQLTFKEIPQLFDVEIQAGLVSDRAKRIFLQGTCDTRPCSLLNNVQKVAKITEKDQIVVLHGSLSKLQKRSAQIRKDSKNQNYVLSLAKIPEIRVATGKDTEQGI